MPALHLRPETITTYEVGWEQAITKQWQFTAAANHYLIGCPIDQVTITSGVNAGKLSFQNTPNYVGNGLGTGLTWRGEHGWRSQLDYTLQHADAQATEGSLPNSPRHRLRWATTVPLCENKLFWNTELTYTAHVLPVTPSGTPIPNPPLSEVPPYALLNTTIYAREFVKSWSVSATVYNLLDRNYRNAVGNEIAFGQIPMDGRTFQVKLTGRF